MTTTAVLQKIDWTFERALHAAQCYIIENRGVGWTAERVAQKMVDEGCGTWHGAWAVQMDRIASGEMTYPTCPYCGGEADERIGFHHMCKAYADAGHGDRIQRMSVIPQCECYPCRQARKALTTSGKRG